MSASKRVKTITALVDRTKVYPLQAALDLVKKTATAKFDESIDVAVNLGIDTKKSDQVVRGQVLGPRGLMPNPKVGTVSPNVAEAVKNAKAGQVQYRADKAGIVQCTIGRASFAVEALAENFEALLGAINKSKPSATKGIYLKKVSVSSTMGVGIKIDQSGMAGGSSQPTH